MSSLNCAMIIGHLGETPILRQTNNKLDVTNFSVATNESFSKDGKKTEKVEWHRVVAFGKVAENCSKFLKKGSLAFIEGKIQTRKFDKDGETRYSTEILASNVQFLSSPKDSAIPKNDIEELAPDFDNIPF